MKTPIYVLVLLAFVLSGCSKDAIDNPIINNDITTIDLKYADADVQTRGSAVQELNIPMDDNVCFRTQLLDSKSKTMGYADFALVEGDVVITFKTDGTWKLVESYLDVIECTSADFPLDANGNPDLKQFKYSSLHKNPVKRVDYFVDPADLSDSMCFAAFARIVNPFGNTIDVWAHGWEMYTPAYQKGCLPDENDQNVEAFCVDADDLEFFIPLKASTSGVYPAAGLNPDTVTLKQSNPTSEGYLDINLNFSGIPLNFKDGVLSISFYDLDLHTDLIESNNRVISFAESFTLRNASGDILAVLDGSHPEDGEFVWNFNLPDNIFTGTNLILTATFTANLELLEGGEIQVTNTAEELFEVSICGNKVIEESIQ